MPAAPDTSVTVAVVVSRTARELGLVTADISDPFASTDPNVLLLTTLLGSLGMRLVRQHSWQHLQVEGTITTANGTADYALPADFKRFIDQTEWDRTTNLPVMSGVSPQQWQYLKGSALAGNTIYKVQRISGGQFHIYPTPTAIESIYYEYQSRYWISATGTATTLAREVPTTNTDILWLDYALLVSGLKLAFRVARGLDSTAELQEYNAALSSALGAQKDAPVLSLNGRGGLKLLGEDNVPDTGYGT